MVIHLPLMSSGICGRIVKRVLISCKIWCVTVNSRHTENIKFSSLAISQWADHLGNAGNADGISISPLHPSNIYLMVHPTSVTGFLFFFFFFFFPFPKEGYWMLMQSHVIKQRVNEGNYLKPGSCSWAKWKQFIFIQFQKQPVLLNKFVFQCTFFLLFQTLLPTPMRVLEPACAGSTERQFSKNSHEHTSTTSSKQNSTWSYQLNAQLAMVGKKPQDTRSDLDLPDPSGLDLPRTRRWAYLALVSEEKWVLLSSGKAAAAFLEDSFALWSRELGSAS